MKKKHLNYTKSQLEVIYRERLEELVKATEGYYFLSKMIGTPPSTVQGWISRGRISKAGAKEVEKHKTLGLVFKASYLRPDL